jgi:hypothetical protein
MSGGEYRHGFNAHRAPRLQPVLCPVPDIRAPLEFVSQNGPPERERASCGAGAWPSARQWVP